MDIEQFEQLMLPLLIGVLVVGMTAVVVKLARQANAGRLGLWIMLGTLGLGVVGFLIKVLIGWQINGS